MQEVILQLRLSEYICILIQRINWEYQNILICGIWLKVTIYGINMFLTQLEFFLTCQLQGTGVIFKTSAIKYQVIWQFFYTISLQFL